MKLGLACLEIDELLELVGLPIAKADPSPLTRTGFDRLVSALATAMQAAGAGVTQSMIDAATDVLDREWGALSAADREKVFARASTEIFTRWAAGATQVAAPIAGAARHTIAATRQATARVHALSIPDVFSARDEKAAAFSTTMHGFYLRTRGGQIIRGAADRAAREVVHNAIDGAWSRQDAAKEMRRALSGSVARTEQWYLEMVASTAIARARTWSMLRSFEDAAITTFKVVAVLDEVTSDVCRFMHGRIFEVQQTIQRFTEVERAPIGDVAELQPFVRQGRDADGARSLYVATSAGRTTIADIERSAVGKIDDVGAIRARLPDPRLQALGCCSPPFHPHCRTTIVPGPTRVVSTPRGRTITQPRATAALPAPPAPNRAPPTTAAPAPRPKLGRAQIGILSSGVSAKATAAFIDEISEPWTLQVLAKFPLSELTLKRSIAKANGWYDPMKRAIAVNMGRKPSTFGAALVPGTTFSMSLAGKTMEDARRRTFVHELGHHIHLLDAAQRTPAFVAIDALIRATMALVPSPLTMYARKNRAEFFAEAFAAYIFERPALEQHAPAVVRMVEDVLAVRGLNVP